MIWRMMGSSLIQVIDDEDDRVAIKLIRADTEFVDFEYEVVIESDWSPTMTVTVTTPLPAG